MVDGSQDRRGGPVTPGRAESFFCGMSIGYEDPTVSYIRTGRVPLDETVTFVDDSSGAGASTSPTPHEISTGSRRAAQRPTRSSYTPGSRVPHERQQPESESV